MKSIAWLILFLTLPGLCLAANALIVHDGTAGIEADALGNLTTHLIGKGFMVTPNVGIPGGSLSTYQQIWDIRFNNTTPLSGGEITTYISYMAAGGSLFVMGENTGFATRNNSIVSLIASAGGGTITVTTPANNQTAVAPFTGPTALSTITFLAAAGTANPGTGGFVTKDAANIAAALVWGPGMLGSATAGSLIAVFDVNFLQAGADAQSQVLTDNLISYLGAPTVVPRVVLPTPTLGEWGMIGLSALLAGMGYLFLRRRAIA